MKGTDLRPGNYVLDSLSNEHKIICSVCHSDGFDVAFVNYKNELDKPLTFLIAPIPLTIDWLNNFGFTGMDIDIYTMNLSNGNFFTIHSFEPIASNIYFVHQLQNIYYFLSGKELILNP